MKRDLPHIAIALRRAREAARLSQYQLADISGVSRPTIAAIEMGSPRNVKSETILKLAQALNISTGELLGTSGHPDQHLERFLTSPMAEQLRVSKQGRRAPCLVKAFSSSSPLCASPDRIKPSSRSDTRRACPSNNLARDTICIAWHCLVCDIATRGCD
jgi:transcriptional regulator with XRE-family HTH domain